jgi:hypothetical protein
VNPVNDGKPAFIFSGGNGSYHGRQGCERLLTIKLFFFIAFFFLIPPGCRVLWVHYRRFQRAAKRSYLFVRRTDKSPLLRRRRLSPSSYICSGNKKGVNLRDKMEKELNNKRKQL